NTPFGQYCMKRMGQGLTGAPFTYARFANTAFGPIPETSEGVKDSEPRLEGDHSGLNAEISNRGKAESQQMKGFNFSHFMDDTYGLTASFDEMFRFLHHHFFPRVVWARIVLNPEKSSFFVPSITILGFRGGQDGITLGEEKRSLF